MAKKYTSIEQFRGDLARLNPGVKFASGNNSPRTERELYEILGQIPQHPVLFTSSSALILPDGVNVTNRHFLQFRATGALDGLDRIQMEDIKKLEAFLSKDNNNRHRNL